MEKGEREPWNSHLGAERMNENENYGSQKQLFEDWKSFFMRKYFHCVYMSVAIKPPLPLSSINCRLLFLAWNTEAFMRAEVIDFVICVFRTCVCSSSQGAMERMPLISPLSLPSYTSPMSILALCLFLCVGRLRCENELHWWIFLQMCLHFPTSTLTPFRLSLCVSKSDRRTFLPTPMTTRQRIK